MSPSAPRIDSLELSACDDRLMMMATLAFGAMPAARGFWLPTRSFLDLVPKVLMRRPVLSSVSNTS